MYKICKTERSTERQKDFQNTLVSMMKREPYKQITITALCKEMEVPRKAFYRYFDELDDVLDSYLDEMMLKSFLFLDSEKIEFAKYFQYWRENSGFLDLIKEHHLENIILERVFSIISTTLPEYYNEKKRIRISAQMIEVVSLVIIWHSTGMNLTSEEMEEVAWECINYGNSAQKVNI